MDNFVVIAIVLIVIALVLLYIIKAKKSGIKCIGCPDAKTCQSKANSCGGCCSSCNGCGEQKNSE